MSGITLVSGIPVFLYAIDTSGRYSLVLEILRDVAADPMVQPVPSGFLSMLQSIMMQLFFSIAGV